MKKKLFFDETSFQEFKSKIEITTNILPVAIAELKVQGLKGVSTLSYESIKKGNFVQTFHEHHKNEMGKHDLMRDAVYEKYLELYGRNTKKLQELEDQYKVGIGNTFSLYTFNHSFFKYWESVLTHKPELEAVFNKSRLSNYNFFDLVTIKGNAVKIEVPKEPFTMYATNSRQIQMMDNIKTFVGTASEIGLKYSDIIGLIQNFLTTYDVYSVVKGKHGLSDDLKEINFNYNQVLTIQ
ncbi:hypothetical protein [Zobellia nedashkovskayae]|uniref:hypothetical protein n=1 Tax=Zobellia nedashkovskayae TaxID=2779510 RepID=UPI00188A5F0D|nr:hypothetical protein [Zobellia nedashkovskayae]